MSPGCVLHVYLPLHPTLYVCPGCVLHVYLPLHSTLYMSPGCVLHVYLPLHPTLYLSQVVYFTSIFPYILLSIYPRLCISRLSSPTTYSLCLPRLYTSRLSSPTSYSLSIPGCVPQVYLPLHPTLYVFPRSVLYGYLPLHPTLYLSQVVYFTSIFPYILLSMCPQVVYFTFIFPFILLSIYPRLCTSRSSFSTSYSLSIPGCLLHVYLPLHPTLYVSPGCVLHVYLPLYPTLYLSQVVYFTFIFHYILLSIYPRLCTSRLSSPTFYSLSLPRLFTSRLSSPTSYSLSIPGCVLHGYLPLHPTLYLSQVVYFTAIFLYILLSIYPRLCTSRLSSPTSYSLSIPRLCTSRLSSPTSYSLSIPGCVLHVYLPLHPTLYLSQVLNFTAIFPYILLSFYPQVVYFTAIFPYILLSIYPQVVYFTAIFPYILLSIYPRLCTSRLSFPSSYSLSIPRLCTSQLSSPTSYSLSIPGCVLHGHLPLHPTLYLSQVVYFTAIFPYILLSIYPRLCTSHLSSPTSYSLSNPGCVLHIYLPLHPTFYLTQVLYFTSIFPYTLLSI